MPEFELLEELNVDGPKTVVGLIEPRFHPQIVAPVWLNRTVHYVSLGLTVSLRLERQQQRFELLRMEIESSSGKVIQTQDLTELSLPDVVYQVCRQAIHDEYFWGLAENSDEKEKEGLSTDTEFLTQLFALEYLCQGNPRNAFMTNLGIPRSTATLRVQQIRLSLNLPKKKAPISQKASKGSHKGPKSPIR